MEQHIADLRKEYIKNILKKEDLNSDPLRQFAIWFEEAQKAEVSEPNAMNLCTVSTSGKPSSRIVLLKGIEEHAMIFFTNYSSVKGKDMLQNPYVALNFFWPELERQVRIEGTVTKTSAEESDLYFNSRPIGSQLGAWASPQSAIVKSREEMEANLLEFERKFKDRVIPRPAHWGGYKVSPEKMEFWQGRASRLHDRFLYSLEGSHWKIDRLAP